MKQLPLLGLGLVVVAFVLGLIQLFKLRFDSGDIYPPYSSFRADPLGAKVLYESLSALRPTQRHLQPLPQLGEGRDQTLLWLGEDKDDLRFITNGFRALDIFVRSGGRLVIALKPTFNPDPTNRFAMGKLPLRPGRGAPTNAPPGRARPRPGVRGMLWEDPRTEKLSAQWGFASQFRALSKEGRGEYKPDTAELHEAPASPTLPPTIKVWTAVGFQVNDSAWRTLYARGTGTNSLGIILERPLGRGTVVLCADSYLFSNEALRDERHPGLLAWFTGSPRQIVFEETHLGVNESPGVAALARKYSLQTFLGALLILAALFLWKNASHFMPPYEAQLATEHSEMVAGRDASAGFVNLLRRNITPAQLLRVCLEQWTAHVARTRQHGQDQLAAMQERIDLENAAPPAQRNPVETYREFSRILRRKA